MARFSEEYYARQVVAYFKSMGYEIYQEVQFGKGWGRRADLVITRGPFIGICEVKTSAGMSVIGQCHRWHGYAHMVWAAIPTSSSVYNQICRKMGIGVLNISARFGQELGHVKEVVRPQFLRRIIPRMKNMLHEAQKTWGVAGSVSDYYSPFKQTCKNLLNIVRQSPGIGMKEVMKKLDHHYSSDSSARNSLRIWASEGKIPSVKYINGCWYSEEIK